MPIHIQAPDGTIAEFPDGTPDATITGVMAKEYPPPKPKAAKPNTGADVAKSFGTGAKEGGLGIADQVAEAIPGLSEVHRFASDVWSAAHGQAPEANANIFSKIGSALVPDHTPQTTAGKYARTVGQFAPAAFGGEGSLVTRAANAIVPAVASETAGQVAQHFKASPAVEQGARLVGALAGGVGASVRANPTAMAPKAAPKATLDTLETAKTAAYKAVDESGIKFTPKAFDTLTQDMAKSMDEQGFNAGLHPKAAAMVEKIGQAQKQTGGHSPTLTQLDQLRQQIGRDVASSSDAGDRRMGQIMRDSIDKFVESATAQHLAEGAPGDAAQLITKARDLNTRVAKLRSLDNLDEAATDRAAGTGSGGNGENALRQNVIRFQNKTKNLTPDEQAATTKAIRGTPSGNMFRQVGKLSPVGDGLMQAGHLGAAVASGGHTLPIAVGAAASKIISKAMTERNVQALRDLIANGGSKAEIAAARQAVIKSQPPLLRLRNPVQPVGNMFSPRREAVAR